MQLFAFTLIGVLVLTASYGQEENDSTKQSSKCAGEIGEAVKKKVEKSEEW